MIVVDATPLQTGHRYRGIGSSTAGLLDALTREQLPVPLGLLQQPPRPTDSPRLADILARPGITVMTLHKPPWRRDRLQWLVSALPTWAAVRHARAQIYHSTEPNGLVLAPGVATVATLHDLIPLHDPTSHFPPRWFDQRIGYARYLRLLHRVDHIIANSQATKQDAVERLRIAAERITVTPFAADPRRFYPCPQDDIDRVVARHDLRRPYFMHASSRGGPSDDNKNTANVLRAFELFARDHDGAHALYIAGKWSPSAIAALRSSYPALVAAGRLRVLGFVPDADLPALYGGADAFVYPSLLEGFGLPVLEAMRCATPVLTSNVSALPEVAGDAALLVDPRSVEEIEAALRRLAGEPGLRADLVARGLQRAEEFSWARTARQTVQVYQRFL